MSNDQSKDEGHHAHELENKQAEELAKELESVIGAQKLGDEAYEMAKHDLAKESMKP